MLCGIDHPDLWKLLPPGRLGLITNPTGVNHHLVSDIDILRDRLVCLFGPEHGIRGMVQDELAVGHGTDRRTGLPEYSLFGETMAPTEAMLAGVDALVFDIQDVGVRFYTYAATMALAMEAAGKKGIPFVVLDRPNPLGNAVEGLIRPEAFKSFLSFLPVCTRHGMTMGELAKFAVQSMEKPPELVIVPCTPGPKPLWVPTSPNMPSLDCVSVYPGACLIEGTSLSEGRGTTKPFEMIGAPWIDGQELADVMNALALSGVIFRPVSFTPLAFKHANTPCGGVQIHVTDKKAFRPVAMGVHLIRQAQRLSGEHWAWRYLPEYGHYMIDLLHGDDSLRTGMPEEEIFARMRHVETVVLMSRKEK